MLASQIQPAVNSSSNSQTTSSPLTPAGQFHDMNPLLPKVQQKILKNLGYSPISVDALTTRSGLSVAEINANLVLLEVDDYIQSHSGGMVSLKSN